MTTLLTDPATRTYVISTAVIGLHLLLLALWTGTARTLRNGLGNLIPVLVVGALIVGAIYVVGVLSTVDMALNAFRAAI